MDSFTTKLDSSNDLPFMDCWGRDFFMAKRPLEVSKAAATWLPALTIHSSLGKQQTLE